MDSNGLDFCFSNLSLIMTLRSSSLRKSLKFVAKIRIENKGKQSNIRIKIFCKKLAKTLNLDQDLKRDSVKICAPSFSLNSQKITKRDMTKYKRERNDYQDS